MTGILGIIILAIIQGIAEFLPISSSAHLIIFRDVFGIGSDIASNVELTFDIALHLGTLLAIGIYFFKDFINMLFKGFTEPKSNDGKMLWYLVIATIPAAIVGLLFEDIVDSFFRKQYLLIALALAIMGVIIYLVDKKSKQENNLKSMSLKDALLIGCSQVFALIPGFSRSGTTIACGRFLKLDRESAAKFSFYLSAPVVLGAVILQIFDSETWTLIGANLNYFITGILVAFISGLLCINFLLKYIKKNDFEVFMWYRLVLALVVVLCLIF